MRGTLWVTTALLIGLGAAPLLDAQQPIARTTTAGVLIDVSILDRDGKPVLDLRGDDFELAEDGKRQQILAATLIRGGSSTPGTAPSSSAAESAVAAPERAGSSPSPMVIPPVLLTVTAILFDRLSPEVRGTARKAAQAYLATLSPPNDYAGVFVADRTMIPFAPFTNQQAVLRDGLDRASMVATAAREPGQRAGGTAVTSGLSLDPKQAPTAGSESGSGFINPLEREKALNAPGPEGPLRRLELRMVEGYQQFLAESEGEAALAGLRSVVDALALLPGRKSVLYFSEGVPITARLKPKFDALIGEANRSNITIYPVDAAGLRVHSEEARLSREVGVAGSQGVGDAKRDDGAYTKELERQEQQLTSRPTAALGRLAKETGGFLLENTNNLAAGVARMQQERTTYYLLAYQPTNAAADGKYRRIEVKVKRPRVTVRARPGYTAAAARQ